MKTKSRILTLQQLCDVHACDGQVELFKQHFGDSVLVTVARAKEFSTVFDFDFAARHFLSKAARKVYKDAYAPARKVHDDTRAAAWKVYEDAYAAAWDVYEDARTAALKVCDDTYAPARKVYEDAYAAAWKVYEDACAPAWKVYEDACAVAFATAYLSEVY